MQYGNGAATAATEILMLVLKLADKNLDQPKVLEALAEITMLCGKIKKTGEAGWY